MLNSLTVKLNEIVFEKAQYWIRECPDGDFEVYKKGATFSTRCAQVVCKGAPGLQRAKEIIDYKIRWDSEKKH